MGDDDEDSDARDRAAILARRQRFIALALSGLAAGCGDDSATHPAPCLDVAPQTESSSVTGPTEGGTTADSSGGQQPCLVAMPDTSSGDGTGAAESTTSTGMDDGQSTGTGDVTSAGDESSGSSTGSPLPCLGLQP